MSKVRKWVGLGLGLGVLIFLFWVCSSRMRMRNSQFMIDFDGGFIIRNTESISVFRATANSRELILMCVDGTFSIGDNLSLQKTTLSDENERQRLFKGVFGAGDFRRLDFLRSDDFCYVGYWNHRPLLVSADKKRAIFELPEKQ